LKAVGLYTHIWKNKDRDNKYTFYAPDVVRNIMMYAMYYSEETLTVLNLLREALIGKKLGDKLKRLVLGRSVKSEKTLFSVEQLSSSPTYTNDPFTGDLRQTAFILSLALGFRISSDTMEVVRPGEIARKYFLAIYYDAAITYKNRVYAFALESPISIESSEALIYEPRVIKNIYSERELNTFIDVAYAYAIGTSLVTEGRVLFAAVKKGILHTSPMWFTQSLTGSTSHAIRMSEAATNSTLKVCEQQTTAIRDTYERQLKTASDELAALKEENQKLKNAVKQLRKEFADVIEATPRDSPNTARQIEDVISVVTELENTIDASEDTIEETNKTVMETSEKAENEAKDRILSFAEQLKIAKENLVSPEIREKEEEVSSNALVAALSRAISERRLSLMQGNEEEEEEDEEEEEQEFSLVPMKTATVIPHVFVPEMSNNIPRRSITKNNRKQPKKSKRSSRSRDKLVSPTRQHFGSTYGLLPWMSS